MIQRKSILAASAVAGIFLSASAMASGAILPKNALSLPKIQSLAGPAITQDAVAGSTDFTVGADEARVWLAGNNKNDDNDDNDDKNDKNDGDRNGFDKDGYDQDGRDKDGYDRDGRNKDGCDKDCKDNSGGPRMQLFIEDARYDGPGAGDEETWAKLGISEFNLWVVGNVGGNGLVGGGQGSSIRDVVFVASFARELLDLGYAPSLRFIPAQDGNRHGFNDFTTPGAVSLCEVPASQPFNASTVPLPDHGMLTPDRVAVNFCLGDFTETGANLANFEPDGPYPYDGTGWYPQDKAGMGQINAYRVLVEGLPVGAQVHFDVYGFTDSKDLAFAPFSHDARWEQIAAIPAPGTFSMFLAGLLGLGWLTRFRQRKQQE